MQDDFEPGHTGRDPYNRQRPGGRDAFGRRKGGSPNWLVVISLAVVGLTILGTLSNLVSPERRAARIGENFDAEVASDPRIGPMMRTLQTSFPDDYERVRSLTIKAYMDDATPAERQAMGMKFIRNFMVAHNGDMAVAPSDSLAKFRVAQVNAVNVLGFSSKPVCAAYVMTGSLVSQKLDDNAITAVAKVTNARLEAIAAGHRSPAVRAALTTADQVAFVRALRRGGVTQAQFDLMADPAKLAAATPNEQCTIGTKISDALMALPTDIADRLTIEMLITDAVEKASTVK